MKPIHPPYSDFPKGHFLKDIVSITSFIAKENSGSCIAFDRHGSLIFSNLEKFLDLCLSRHWLFGKLQVSYFMKCLSVERICSFLMILSFCILGGNTPEKILCSLRCIRSERTGCGVVGLPVTLLLISWVRCYQPGFSIVKVLFSPLWWCGKIFWDCKYPTTSQYFTY